MPRAQGVQPPPQLVLSEEPQQQFDLRQAASTFASAGSQQPVALQKPQLKPQPQLPQQLHLKPLDHRATVAGSSCAGRAAAASLGFTAAGAWPVGSTFNSTDSGGGGALCFSASQLRCAGSLPGKAPVNARSEQPHEQHASAAYRKRWQPNWRRPKRRSGVCSNGVSSTAVTHPQQCGGKETVQEATEQCERRSKLQRIVRHAFPIHHSRC